MNTKIMRTFVLLKVLESITMAWFLSTYVLFLLDNGLTLLQTTQLNLAFMAISTLFDPITGSLGDKFGQKLVYLTGTLVWATSMLVYGLSSTFQMFLLAEFIGALANAMLSEALESWVRNTLSSSETHRALSIAGSWSQVAAIPSAILGAIAGQYWGLKMPFILGGVSMLVTFCLGWALLKGFGRLEATANRHEQPNSVLATLLEGIKLTVTVKQLRFGVMVTMISSATFQAFSMFWTPVLKEQGSEIWWLGLVWVGVALAIGFGSFNSQHVKSTKPAIAGVLLYMGAVMVVSKLVPSFWPILAMFLLYEIGRGALPNLLFTYVNEHIPDHVRTTTNSLRSSARTLGAVLGLFVAGQLTTFLPVLDVWLVSSLSLVLLGCWVLWHRKER